MLRTEQITPSGSSQNAPFLSFQRILERVQQLGEGTLYIVIEFDHRGEFYTSKELRGSEIQLNARHLFWHASHSYRIIEKNMLKSPLSIGIGHRVPESVEKILH